MKNTKQTLAATPRAIRSSMLPPPQSGARIGGMKQSQLAKHVASVINDLAYDDRVIDSLVGRILQDHQWENPSDEKIESILQSVMVDVGVRRSLAKLCTKAIVVTRKLTK